MNVEAKFFSKVDTSDPDRSGCWLWTGSKVPLGYGIFTAGDGYRTHAHRISYLLYVGPIGEGLEVHHSCGVKACVNPDHLGTGLPPARHADGRGPYGLAALNAVKTHCPRGHDFETHGVVYPSGGRRCRTCDCARKVANYAASKAAA